MPRVVIVADDLTGALDVAGPFANRGHATWVAVDRRRVEAAHFAAAEVLSVNATSRHLPAAQAAALVSETIEQLCVADAEILIKKVDSTLRGNVVAETLAALAASGRPNAIVVPAFPAQGRTVHGAVVHVHGVALPQTAFARDALSPPPLEPLDRVFRRAAPEALVARASPQGPFPLAARGQPMRIFVVDSANDADLDATVRALGAGIGDCVLVGSAGVAAAAARVCMHDRPNLPPPRVEGDILMVVGSRAEQCAQQVEVLAREPGVAVFAAPDGAVADQAILVDRTRVAVLRAVASTDGAVANAADVARGLAACALRVLRSRDIGALLATGGDTAIALLSAMEVSALQVMGDLLPGIPYARLTVQGRTLWLITKAGGFGAPDTLRQVVARLRTAATSAQ